MTIKVSRHEPLAQKFHTVHPIMQIPRFLSFKTGVIHESVDAHPFLDAICQTLSVALCITILKTHRLNVPPSPLTVCRPGGRCLHVHPLAISAYDTLSALGGLEMPGRIGRAVPGTATDLLVFGGFGVFFLPPAERILVVEDGLPPTDISRAAWDDVIAILGVLGIPSSARRAFAQTLAHRAPGDRLAELSLPADRTTTALLQRLGLRSRHSAVERQPTIFQSALRQFRKRDA